VASHLTNQPGSLGMIFRVEHPDGTVQTDWSHKGLVHTTLWFWQYQFPLTSVGSGCHYDVYKMDMRITPHVPDGP